MFWGRLIYQVLLVFFIAYFVFMAFESTWEKHGVVLHCFGIVTMLDLIEANSEISGELEWDELQYIIIDLREVAGLKVNKRMFGNLLSFLRKIYHRNRSFKIVYLIHDLFKPDTLSLDQDSGNSAYFYCIEDAREWVQSSKVIVEND